MEKELLLKAVAGIHEAWEATLDELGADRLEQPGANGDWRVRDVLAHFNGWDRWQLVQLRCAFTGEIPTDDELFGGIAYPPNDDMHEDAMNAMFVAGTQGLPTAEILRHWREVFTMCADWAAAASQDQLDALIGVDRHSENARILRLASEVPSVNNPVPVWQNILDQVEHQKEHLETVRAWMVRN